MAIMKISSVRNFNFQGDEEWMTKREERGRMGTALLQPMAVYEAPGRNVGGMGWVYRGNGWRWRMLLIFVGGFPFKRTKMIYYPED